MKIRLSCWSEAMSSLDLFPTREKHLRVEGITYGLLHLPALRFFVVLLALSSEGLLQNDTNLYFRENFSFWLAASTTKYENN
jgi:hypothetical protein